MKQVRTVLSFPPDSVEEPVTYHLISDYGLRVNILRARIDPGKQGRMVVDLEGDDSQLAAGLNYLERVGVEIKPLTTEIRHVEETCTACTACIPHCPTGALSADREDSWAVVFEPEKCIVCLSCMEVCIYGAMELGEE